MTYNVNYGVAGDAEPIRLIEESGADVVMLQETNRAWEGSLRAGLSHIYQHMAYLDLVSKDLPVLARPLRATAARVVDGGASDHVPVLARIERAPDPS